MKVVRSLEERNWRRFVDSHPASNVFHTPEMFRVFSRTKMPPPTLWAVVDDDASVLALLPLVQITLINLLRRLTTRAVSYGGVLCDTGPKGRDALALLLQEYVRQVDGSLLETELRNQTNLERVQLILQQHGFVYEDYPIMMMQLDQSSEQVLERMSKNTRWKIRKGLRDKQVEIKEISEKDDLDSWYTLVQMNYAFHSKRGEYAPLPDRSLFEATFDEMTPQGMAKFLLGYVDGEPAACSLELVYGAIIHGWYAGMDRKYGRYNPGELLMWHILKWGAENGYRMYNFGGAGRADEQDGLYHFKVKFGARPVCCGRNTCVHSHRLLGLSSFGFDVYRHLKAMQSQFQ
jgi:hypothetical protein